MNRAKEILDRIKNYLVSGGLFNPEAMEHKKVRDLIMDARDLIDTQNDLLHEVACSGIEYKARKYYVVQISADVFDLIQSLQLTKGDK